MSTSPLSSTPISKKVSPTGAKKRLLEFLRELLNDVTNCDVITWTDHANEEFRMVKPHEVANRWGAATGNTSMTYDKMSRGLRYFYTNQTLEKIPGKDSRYRFLPGTNTSASSSPPQPHSQWPLGLINFSSLSGFFSAQSALQTTSSLPSSGSSFNIDRFLPNANSGSDSGSNLSSSPSSSPTGSSLSTPPSSSSNSDPSTVAPTTPPATKSPTTATSQAFDPIVFNMFYQLYMAFPELIPKND